MNGQIGAKNKQILALNKGLIPNSFTQVTTPYFVEY
jgi:hypothetical protein